MVVRCHTFNCVLERLLEYTRTAPVVLTVMTVAAVRCTKTEKSSWRCKERLVSSGGRSPRPFCCRCRCLLGSAGRCTDVEPKPPNQNACPGSLCRSAAPIRVSRQRAARAIQSGGYRRSTAHTTRTPPYSGVSRVSKLQLHCGHRQQSEARASSACSHCEKQLVCTVCIQRRRVSCSPQVRFCLQHTHTCPRSESLAT